jgi:hypothetical protein
VSQRRGDGDVKRTSTNIYFGSRPDITWSNHDVRYSPQKRTTPQRHPPISSLTLESLPVSQNPLAHLRNPAKTLNAYFENTSAASRIAGNDDALKVSRRTKGESTH